MSKYDKIKKLKERFEAIKKKKKLVRKLMPRYGTEKLHLDLKDLLDIP